LRYMLHIDVYGIFVVQFICMCVYFAVMNTMLDLVFLVNPRSFPRALMCVTGVGGCMWAYCIRHTTTTTDIRLLGFLLANVAFMGLCGIRRLLFDDSTGPLYTKGVVLNSLSIYVVTSSLRAQYAWYGYLFVVAHHVDHIMDGVHVVVKHTPHRGVRRCMWCICGAIQAGVVWYTRIYAFGYFISHNTSRITHAASYADVMYHVLYVLACYHVNTCGVFATFGVW
jgi:hypothetical protein